ncbi:MAG: hypothetical protein CMC79_00095 [Flavobacteriaceae bacterium]|nr:hypothetical protein [Flavobacteriaceae bacterium]
MKTTTYNSDHLGVITSSLCILHCLASPFLYFSSLWQSFNYLFILVSFIAIFRSVENSSNIIIKGCLSSVWFFLCLLILNEEFEIISLSEFYTYTFAFTLGSLHIYNLKYCRCKDDNCCTHK